MGLAHIAAAVPSSLRLAPALGVFYTLDYGMQPYHCFLLNLESLLVVRLQVLSMACAAEAHCASQPKACLPATCNDATTYFVSCLISCDSFHYEIVASDYIETQSRSNKWNDAEHTLTDLFPALAV